MPKVSIYTREHSTRRLKPAKPKTIYPMGTIFVLRYAGRWQTLPQGTKYQDAVRASLSKQIDLHTGIEQVEPKPKRKPAVLMLDAAVNEFLEVRLKAKAKTTKQAYALSLKGFQRAVGDKPLSEISQQDLVDFQNYLLVDGYADRTISNRVGNVVTLLRRNGIRDVTLRVRYVERKIRAYRPDELTALFAACESDEWLLFQFFLCSGAREQEVMHAEKSDIDFEDGIFAVLAKSKWNWKPKDYEEREIPLPDFLLKELKARPDGLLFPAKNRKRDSHYLRVLKRVAQRGKLKGNWTLHQFRRTYATLQHRAGIDARTIQRRLGHSDLETALRYLEGEEPRSKSSRQQVNSTFAIFA